MFSGFIFVSSKIFLTTAAPNSVGDTVESDGDVTLSAGNGLFDVTIKGTTSIDEARLAMEDIAMIVFNEYVDLTLDEYTSTEV